MIIHDKKQALQSIMAKRHPKDSVEETSSAPMVPSIVKTEEGEIDPRHTAAQDILMSVHEGHPGKLMESLKNFIELHSGQSQSEPSESSEQSE